MDEQQHDLSNWMTAQEVADWLGTTTRQLAANRIPHAQVGEKRFYDKRVVARWLDTRMRRDYPSA